MIFFYCENLHQNQKNYDFLNWDHFFKIKTSYQGIFNWKFSFKSQKILDFFLIRLPIFIEIRKSGVFNCDNFYQNQENYDFV